MHRVLVFCGSSPGARPEYRAAAEQLGGQLARRGLELVYGGARVGLMGAVADATLAGGGRAIGVIPRHLIEAEVAHAGLSQLHVVDTMHERKALMSQLADAVIALPGGTGTLDELFELFTWRQLGLHRMPLGVLNVCGYWDGLLAFLQHSVEERFLRAEHLASLIVAIDSGALLDELGAARPAAGVLGGEDSPAARCAPSGRGGRRALDERPGRAG
jgi:uncharacterized protein (TIGR00730 family)